MMIARNRGFATLALGTLLVVGCRPTDQGPSPVAGDSATHWLRVCTLDDNCGDLDCVCGVCSARCEGDSACGMLDSRSECSSGSHAQDACMSASDAPSICVLQCSTSEDCRQGLECDSGFCVGPRLASDSASDNGDEGDRGNKGNDQVVPLPTDPRDPKQCDAVGAGPVDKLDLLFVIDNSGSMAEEQMLLRDQFPKLIQALTSGMRADGGTFSPAKDLHLGVVSTDMGLAGVAGVMSCEKPAGDDGIMLNVPDASIQGCPASAFSERFLRYTMGGTTTPERIGQEFGCIASLGTLGCGYEQQLEAGLKALWPSVDIDPTTGMQWVDPSLMEPSNRINFLSTTQDGSFGQGDRANTGFLRNSPEDGLSLIAVVVVTDEDDCSSTRSDHFVPGPSLPNDSPYATQGQNLRCYLNGDSLYGVERYVQGFQALRPGNEDMVIFAAIAGVPSNLVSPERLEMVDFQDPADRDEFYAGILDDPRMQERIDPATAMTPDINDDNVVPSCDQPGLGRAYPPRRLVETARRFGEQGIVQSICQPSFEPAVDAIIDRISQELGEEYCDPTLD